MEQTLTDKMYSTITNKRFFEEEVLNSGSEHYFYYKIQNFTKYKNSLLITNEELKHRYEVLSVFNNQIQSIMFEIIVSYRLVIDCNKTNEKLHFDGLKIRLNSKLEYINRFFIPSIRYNYDDNHLLGYKMNEYCISAFDTMFDKLENDYMIDIKKSPLFSSIENVYDKYLNLFDVEKMKVLSIPMHKTPKSPAPENKQVKTFEEFFNEDVNDELIQKIQTEFKDYKGKKLAFLIYLLHKVHKLIDYSSNSNTEARKHFIRGLTGKVNIVAGVDKIFNLNDVTISDPKFENDNDYITIREKLQKTIRK